MARAFSRRSFLKYTAVAAVAVAGSSLLTGCEHGDNPVQTEIGTTNTVLKVQSTLESVTYEGNDTLAFRLKIYNGRPNPIDVYPENFVIKSGSYYAYLNGNIALEYLPQSNADEDAVYTEGPRVKNKETTTVIIRALNVPNLKAGDTITMQYFPDVQGDEGDSYPEYSASWMLAAEKLGTAAD